MILRYRILVIALYIYTRTGKRRVCFRRGGIIDLVTYRFRVLTYMLSCTHVIIIISNAYIINIIYNVNDRKHK